MFQLIQKILAGNAESSVLHSKIFVPQHPESPRKFSLHLESPTSLFKTHTNYETEGIPYKDPSQVNSLLNFSLIAQFYRRMLIAHIRGSLSLLIGPYIFQFREYACLNFARLRE